MSEVLGLEIPFLVFSFLSVRVVRADLLRLCGIVTLVAAAKVVTAWGVLGDAALRSTGLPVLAAFAAGCGVLLLSAGMLGTRLKPANYASIFAAVVAFPWYTGAVRSGIYLVLAAAVVSVVLEVRARRAYASVGARRMSRRWAERNLTAEQLQQVQTRGSTVFAVWFLLAAVSALLIPVS